MYLSYKAGYAAALLHAELTCTQLLFCTICYIESNQDQLTMATNFAPPEKKRKQIVLSIDQKLELLH